MKKKTFITVLLSLSMILCLFSGCKDAKLSGSSKAPQEDTKALTIEKAYEENRVGNLLQKYKTITYAQLDYIGGDTIHKIFYTDEEGNACVTGDSFTYTDYQTDFFQLFYDQSEGTPVYTISAAEWSPVSDYMFMVPDSAFTSQTIDAMGNLVCVAQADISQDYADQLSDYWPATTEDKMVTTTVFSPEDFRILSIDFTIRRPDGSESKIVSGVMIYNKDVVHTNKVQDYLNSEKVTVSIQMKDGRTRSVEIPKGETFTWYCDEGYTLYLDKDGKNQLQEKPEPVKEDLTLYCLPKQ